LCAFFGSIGAKNKNEKFRSVKVSRLKTENGVLFATKNSLNRNSLRDKNYASTDVTLQTHFKYYRPLQFIDSSVKKCGSTQKSKSNSNIFKSKIYNNWIRKQFL